MGKQDFELFENTPNELPPVGEQRTNGMKSFEPLPHQPQAPSVTDVVGATERGRIFILNSGQVTIKSTLGEELTYDIHEENEIGKAVRKFAEPSKEEKLDSFKHFSNGGKPRNPMERNYIQKILSSISDKIKSGEY